LRYSFYHLSIKEAIQTYLKDHEELFTLNQEKLKDDEILLETVIKQNQDYINGIVYLDKNSDSYNFLVKLINYLKTDTSSKYYNENFFHIYNSITWFNIFHNQISYEDMKNENYASILTTTELSDENKNEIEEFFIHFDKKEQKHLFEIRYAYELAFIKEDYQKVLEYKDLYEDYINQIFLDICLNIDKIEYIEKFIEYKNDWLNTINDNTKDIFINIILQQENINDKFDEVLKLLSDNHKALLRFKNSPIEVLKTYANTNFFSIQTMREFILKANNLETALYITEVLTDSLGKSEILLLIANKTNNTSILMQVIDMAIKINNDDEKLKVLATIIYKTNENKIFIKILDAVEFKGNNFAKSKLLSMIIERTNDNILLKKIINIIETINSNSQKSALLTKIIMMLNDDNIFKIIINITETIHDNSQKSDVLARIVAKTNNNEILKNIKILIQDMSDIEKFNISIAIKTKTFNTESLLEIINHSNTTEKLEILLIIIERTNELQILTRIINIIETIDYNWKIIEFLLQIINKTNNTSILMQIIDVVIKLNYQELKVLATIIHKTNDSRIFIKILDVVKLINHHEVSEILSIIIERTNDQEVFTKIINTIGTINYYYIDLSFIIEKIISKNNNNNILKKIIDLVSIIDDTQEQLKLLTFIACATNNKKILNSVIKLAEDINANTKKSEILLKIIKNIDDIIQSIVIAKNIKNIYNRFEAFIIIATKHKRNDIFLEALKTINNIVDPRIKNEFLIKLVDKTNDEKIFHKLLKIESKGILFYEKFLIALVNKTNNESILEKILEKIDKIILLETEKDEVLTTIAIKTKNDKVLKKTLREIKNLHEPFVYSKIKSSMLAKEAIAKDNIKEATAIAQDIFDDRIKSKTLGEIALKNNNVEMAKNINDNWYRSKTLSLIAQQTNNVTMLLILLKDINVDTHKLETLSSLILKMENREIYKIFFDFATRVKHDYHRYKSLLNITNKTNNVENYFRILEIIDTLDIMEEKVEILYLIISKTNNKNILKDIFALIMSMDNIKYKIYIMKAISSKDSEIIRSKLFYNRLNNSKINFSDTINIVTSLSHNDILKYYGIYFKNETANSRLLLLIDTLQQLINNSQDKKEKRKKFNKIKEQILDDEDVLNEFIEKYGKTLDIEDEDSFDDKFSLKTFEENKKIFDETF
ncbi:MAG: hypothetical protein QM490_00940, partial [Candidatus Gracilibacteria bacterium]